MRADVVSTQGQCSWVVGLRELLEALAAFLMLAHLRFIRIQRPAGDSFASLRMHLMLHRMSERCSLLRSFIQLEEIEQLDWDGC